MLDKIVRYLMYLSLKKRKNAMESSLLRAYSVYKKFRNIVVRGSDKTISKKYLQYEHLKKKIVGGKYSFVTVDELVIWTTEWIKSFPTSYDLIIGIPRSGLLVATIIALKLGKPLSTPELFCQNQFFKSDVIPKKREYKNILLVDDSFTSGRTMEKSLKLLLSHQGNLNITRATLITTKNSANSVDLYYKIIPHPRIFEWNIVHAKKGKLASDLDGVICENCPPGIDSHEDLYIEWIKTAKPYIIPTFEIDVIISSRLERYRSETEMWLAKHGVRYKELILWDIKSKKERKGNHGRYKSEILLKYKPDRFWESSLKEAEEVWEATKIPTWCLDEMVLFT